ncbi:MAG: hypothetical protein P1V97_07180, partial [Planctomycetota bacterium]|nr:hypothetical protein [Planctomycetota bacterium]
LAKLYLLVVIKHTDKFSLCLFYALFFLLSLETVGRPGGVKRRSPFGGGDRVEVDRRYSVEDGSYGVSALCILTPSKPDKSTFASPGDPAALHGFSRCCGL